MHHYLPLTCNCYFYGCLVEYSLCRRVVHSFFCVKSYYILFTYILPINWWIHRMLLEYAISFIDPDSLPAIARDIK